MVRTDRIPSPDKLIKSVFIGYFTLFIIAPLSYYKINWGILLFFILSFMALYFGSKSNTLPRSFIEKQFSESYLKKLYYTTYFLAALGFIFKIYDRLIIRGFKINLSAMENRALGIEESSNLFAIIGSMFFLFGIIALWLILIRRFRIGFLFKITTYIFYFYLTFEGILLGSRFSFFINFVVYFLLLYFSNRIKSLFHPKTIVIGTLIFLFFLFISTKIFIDRVETYGADPIAYIEGEYGYGESVRANQTIVNFLKKTTSDNIFYPIVFGLVNMVQYILHGYFELQDLIINHSIKNYPFTFGADNFYVFSKFFSKIAPSIFQLDTSKYYVRTGRFTTFLGPMYIDFGYFSILILFFLGRYVKKVWSKIQMGDIRSVPLYAIIILFIMLFPIINYFKGFGNYVFFTFSLYWLISRLLSSIFNLK